jgi:hypothetical protein
VDSYIAALWNCRRGHLKMLRDFGYRSEDQKPADSEDNFEHCVWIGEADS